MLQSFTSFSDLDLDQRKMTQWTNYFKEIFDYDIPAKCKTSIHVDIDQGIHKGKMKVALNEKRNMGFLFP